VPPKNKLAVIRESPSVSATKVLTKWWDRWLKWRCEDRVGACILVYTTIRPFDSSKVVLSSAGDVTASSFAVRPHVSEWNRMVIMEIPSKLSRGACW
jgi:hypothetical protein